MEDQRLNRMGRERNCSFAGSSKRKPDTRKQNCKRFPSASHTKKTFCAAVATKKNNHVTTDENSTGYLDSSFTGSTGSCDSHSDFESPEPPLLSDVWHQRYELNSALTTKFIPIHRRPYSKFTHEASKKVKFRRDTTETSHVCSNQKVNKNVETVFNRLSKKENKLKCKIQPPYLQKKVECMSKEEVDEKRKKAVAHSNDVEINNNELKIKDLCLAIDHMDECKTGKCLSSGDSCKSELPFNHNHHTICSDSDNALKPFAPILDTDIFDKLQKHIMRSKSAGFRFPVTNSTAGINGKPPARKVAFEAKQKNTKFRVDFPQEEKRHFSKSSDDLIEINGRRLTTCKDFKICFLRHKPLNVFRPKTSESPSHFFKDDLNFFATSRKTHRQFSLPLLSARNSAKQNLRLL